MSNNKTCPRCNKLLDSKTSVYPGDPEVPVQKITSFFHSEKEGCDYRYHAEEILPTKKLEIVESPVFVTLSFPLKVDLKKVIVDGVTTNIEISFNVTSGLDAEQLIQQELRKQLNVPDGMKSDYTNQVLHFNLGFKKE